MSHQPLPLVEQLKNLEHLQELDLKIDSLKRDKSSLPTNLKTIDDSLQKLRVSLNSKKDQANEIEKVARQTRAALDLNRDRLARSNSKLESVHNSQEFQAANKEIEQLKKLNSTLEEQGKKSEVELEALQKEIGGIEEEFNKIQTQRNSQETVILGKDSQFSTDIASLMAERAKYTCHVESRILAQYDRIRSARGGLGVVPTVGGRCKGCNMMVPPQLYNEVQRGSTLHSCPSCHRLLFVPSSSPVATNGTSTASDLPDSVNKS